MKHTGKRVEYYTDAAGEWRWTQYGANGEVTGAAHEGFSGSSPAKARGNWLIGQRDAGDIFRDGFEYTRPSDVITVVIDPADLPDGKGTE